MAKKAKVSINVTVSANTSVPAPRKAYNNQPLGNGEVLVPMMATEERIKVMDICTANLRTWSMGGKKYRVMFYPVLAEYKDIAMTQFNTELNEFLGERRDARCMIPQEDGTLKVCPKKNGDNRCACVDCPHKNEYSREDKTISSLDSLRDEFDYEPVSNESAEDAALLGILFSELIDELKTINIRYADIVEMLIYGYNKQDVIEKLKLNKSQGYNEIKKAEELVKKFLFS